MSSPANARNEPRWTRRKEARPEEITAAALELFVERGFAATRLEDVAARAGVSKGTVYLYFANKEELFKAVVREGLVSPIAEMKDYVAQFPGSTFDLLRMLVLGWWEKVGATRMAGIPKLLLGESGNFPELVRFYLAEVVEPGHAVMTAIVKRGIARGEFRKVNPEDGGAPHRGATAADDALAHRAGAAVQAQDGQRAVPGSASGHARARLEREGGLTP